MLNAIIRKPSLKKRERQSSGYLPFLDCASPSKSMPSSRLPANTSVEGDGLAAGVSNKPKDDWHGYHSLNREGVARFQDASRDPE